MNHNSTYFLHPATIFAGTNSCEISTILGSCVSVCLWDCVLEIGGINHFLLPLWNGKGLASPKYGNIAIEKLIEKMLDLGANKKNLKAKIFGGADVLHTNLNQFNIGARNIELAREILKDKKITIVSSSVGGNLGRKILFHTKTGVIKQKYIQKISNR